MAAAATKDAMTPTPAQVTMAEELERRRFALIGIYLKYNSLVRLQEHTTYYQNEFKQSGIQKWRMVMRDHLEYMRVATAMVKQYLADLQKSMNSINVILRQASTVTKIAKDRAKQIRYDISKVHAECIDTDRRERKFTELAEYIPFIQAELKRFEEFIKQTEAAASEAPFELTIADDDADDAESSTKQPVGAPGDGPMAAALAEPTKDELTMKAQLKRRTDALWSLSRAHKVIPELRAECTAMIKDSALKRTLLNLKYNLKATELEMKLGNDAIKDVRDSMSEISIILRKAHTISGISRPQKREIEAEISSKPNISVLTWDDKRKFKDTGEFLSFMLEELKKTEEFIKQTRRQFGFSDDEAFDLTITDDDDAKSSTGTRPVGAPGDYPYSDDFGERHTAVIRDIPIHPKGKKHTPNLSLQRTLFATAREKALRTFAATHKIDPKQTPLFSEWVAQTGEGRQCPVCNLPLKYDLHVAWTTPTTPQVKPRKAPPKARDAPSNGGFDAKEEPIRGSKAADARPPIVRPKPAAKAVVVPPAPTRDDAKLAALLAAIERRNAQIAEAPPAAAPVPPAVTATPPPPKPKPKKIREVEMGPYPPGRDVSVKKDGNLWELMSPDLVAQNPLFMKQRAKLATQPQLPPPTQEDGDLDDSTTDPETAAGVKLLSSETDRVESGVLGRMTALLEQPDLSELPVALRTAKLTTVPKLWVSVHAFTALNQRAGREIVPVAAAREVLLQAESLITEAELALAEEGSDELATWPIPDDAAVAAATTEWTRFQLTAARGVQLRLLVEAYTALNEQEGCEIVPSGDIEKARSGIVTTGADGDPDAMEEEQKAPTLTWDEIWMRRESISILEDAVAPVQGQVLDLIGRYDLPAYLAGDFYRLAGTLRTAKTLWMPKLSLSVRAFTALNQLRRPQISPVGELDSARNTLLQADQVVARAEAAIEDRKTGLLMDDVDDVYSESIPDASVVAAAVTNSASDQLSEAAESADREKEALLRRIARGQTTNGAYALLGSRLARLRLLVEAYTALNTQEHREIVRPADIETARTRLQQLEAAVAAAKAGQMETDDATSATWTGAFGDFFRDAKSDHGYTRVRKLGEGSFGTVFLVRKEGKLYAEKEIACEGNREPSTACQMTVTREVQFLQKLKFPYIIGYRDYWRNKDKKPIFHIVTEYATGGDLRKRIQTTRRVFTEDEIIVWLTELLLAVKHIHDKQIIHRDIKPENILVVDNHIRLGDFGLMKMLTKKDTAAGTIKYLSPEVFQGKPQSKASDMWAVGFVLGELMALRDPFVGALDSWTECKQAVLTQTPSLPLEANEYYPHELKEIFASLLEKDPKRRPSVEEVLEIPILKNRIQDLLTPEQYSAEFGSKRRGWNDPNAEEKAAIHEEVVQWGVNVGKVIGEYTATIKRAVDKKAFLKAILEAVLALEASVPVATVKRRRMRPKTAVPRGVKVVQVGAPKEQADEADEEAAPMSGFSM